MIYGAWRMKMSVKDIEPKPLIPSDLLVRWQDEFARQAGVIEAAGKAIEAAEKKRTALKSLIDAATSLVAEPPETISAEEQTRPPKLRTAKSKAKRRSLRKGAERPTWKSVIKAVVEGADRPMPYVEIKAEIRKTAFGAGKDSEKGFYGAVTRLIENDEVVRHKAHLFSHEAYRKYREDLKAGRARRLKMPNVAHYSPMGEAVKKIIENRPNGAQSGHIKWELRKSPEFAASLDKNPTHIYNVLSRLTKDGFLFKRGKRYYYAHLQDETPGPSEPSASRIHHGKGSGVPLSSGDEEGLDFFTPPPGAKPAEPGQ